MNAQTYSLIDDSPEQYLACQGYQYSVVLSDEKGEVVDVVDFKTEFAARTYAAFVNMQGA